MASGSIRIAAFAAVILLAAGIQGGTMAGENERPSRGIRIAPGPSPTTTAPQPAPKTDAPALSATPSVANAEIVIIERPARRGFRLFRWLRRPEEAPETSRTLPGGLPQGRAYFRGRYFGNFNNRYYGPQYGYF